MDHLDLQRLLVMTPTVTERPPPGCTCSTDPIVVACDTCRAEARRRADVRRLARKALRGAQATS